jgi:TonB family protein
MILLFDATVKTSLIIGCALAAMTRLRARSAATRHWLLAAAIACAAAAPLVPSIAPGWPAPDRLWAWASQTVWSARAGVVTDTVSVRSPSRVSEAAISPADSTRPARTGSAITPLRAIAAIYAAGVAMNLGILLAGLGRLAWLVSQTRRRQPSPWVDLTRAIARDMALDRGLRRPLLLLHGDHPSLVMTWGLFRPKVLLPASAGDWSAQRVRIVLGHELAHIERGDWAIQIGAALLRCVYWFNPLVWIACRRLRFESERACDDAVLRAGVEGSVYATHVLDLARVRGKQLRAPWPALAMASESGLERRIRAMLNVGINRSPVTRSTRAAIAVALSALTLSVAGLSAAQPSVSTRYSGSIVDPSGVPIAGAAVTVTDKQGGVGQAITTDSRGYFEYANLAPGDYVIDVKSPGFSARHDGFRLNPGEQTQRNFRLQIGSVSEVVSVTSSAEPYMPREATASPEEAARWRDKMRGHTLAPPTKIKDVRPYYPQRLEAAGVSGSVTLEGTIGTDGVLANLVVVPPANPDLAQAAVAAVREWRYTPTLLHGVPIATDVSVSINFLRER